MAFAEPKKKKKDGKYTFRQLDACSDLQYVQVDDQLYTEHNLSERTSTYALARVAAASSTVEHPGIWAVLPGCLLHSNFTSF